MMNGPKYPLIYDYKMKLVELACEPGSCEYKIELVLPSVIDEAFPYINAATDSIDYLHNEKFLSFRHNEIFCSMRPNLITIAIARSRVEALEKTDTIIGVINDIWHMRDQIEPKYTGRKPKPQTLSVYKLLPRTNCSECGLATCMAFASALTNDQAQVDECPYLSQTEHAQNRSDLIKLLAG
jgi:ArsR family metal-binding transcriptional regulator